MKHRRLMMLAILLTLVGSIFADNLTVSGIELKAGETQQAAINLNNDSKNYVAFQFDIALPEGISIAKNDKGKLMISLNTDRIDDHTLTVQDLGSGSYRLLCFSMTNAEFYDTSGALVKITLQAGESINAGTKQGQITSQVFTETNGSQVKWSDVSFDITVAAAGSSTVASSLTVSETELKVGNEQEMVINLNNGTKKYVAFQFDIALPEGITIAKNNKGKLKISLNTDRIDDHTLTVQDLGSGNYRLLCFSMTNAEFYDTNGALVNITMLADNSISVGTKEGVIKSQVFTEPDGNQEKWDDVTFNISVAAAVIPEITADDKTRKYGEENPELTYKVSAELKGMPELTTTATKTSPVGVYDIVVSKGTIEGSYTAKNGKLTITKTPLTITAKSYTIKQGETLPTFEAEYVGFKNNETETVLTKKPTLATKATSASEPGTYEITVSGAEAQNYELSYVKGTLTIIEADPVTITAKSYTRTYGEDNPTFEYEISGVALNGTPEITCEATATSPVGTYPIVINKGSVTNYNDTYVNGTLTIIKAPLSVKAGIYTKKQGEDNPEFTLTYEGFKNNETEVVLIKKPTATTTATKESEPGEYVVTVSGGEAQNYELSCTNGKLIVTNADPVTITAKSYTREYGEDNPTFEYTSKGTTLVGTPEITCQATANSPVGTYDIVIKKGTVTNYNDTYINGTLTIKKAPLTVKTENVTREQYLENPDFAISYSGWKLDEDESVLTKKPTATTTATKDSPIGEYEIVVSGGEAQNYEFSYQNGVLTIIESTGIAAISVTNPADVYNIQGRMIRSKATTLEGLPSGVYIVNGQKVVVK